MACRKAYRIVQASTAATAPTAPVIKSVSETVPTKTVAPVKVPATERLLFGVDSRVNADDLLQNNIRQFDWVVRNKIQPNFWGRNIIGDNSLTKREIEFLHGKGCKIAAIYPGTEEKKTEEQGQVLARKIDIVAIELGIPDGAAIFLEIGDNETATTAFMRGFATAMMHEGYTPGFKANTDANYGFDHDFSRGLQNDREVFSKCLVWAVTPSLAEYQRMTTSHLIHPDNWVPYAPSGITRREIAVWQYGKNCHPIEDDTGKETVFNLNLVRNESVIIDKMF